MNDEPSTHAVAEQTRSMARDDSRTSSPTPEADQSDRPETERPPEQIKPEGR